MSRPSTTAKLSQGLQDELAVALKKSAELKANRTRFIKDYTEAVQEAAGDEHDLTPPTFSLSNKEPVDTSGYRTRSQKRQQCAGRTDETKTGQQSSAPTARLAGFHATALFAQYECGTAMLIRICSGHKMLLTCAHCLGERSRKGISKFLVFTDGTIVLAKSVKVDRTADLAVMSIVGFYDDEDTLQLVHYVEQDDITRPSVTVSPNGPLVGDALVCCGQPGRDDLESQRPRKTGYDIVTTSAGEFERNVSCEEEGTTTLQHTCWTYWGHSGAALLNSRGQVVGVHSSWDDATATRHGVPWSDVHHFLREL